MVNLNLKSLVDKMSPTLRQSLEGAAGLCIGRGHYNVEVEHWLLTLLQDLDSDFVSLLKRYGVDLSRIQGQLTATIERFTCGSSRPAALAPAIVEASKNAWLVATVDYGHTTITSAHLLVALLLDDQSRHALLDSVPELAQCAPESVRETARTVIGSTGESAPLSSVDMNAGESGKSDTVNPSKTPALDKFTINLTAKARAGGIDPVLGRDIEIRQCVDILTRRRQNNPILTGEAGVGKTAVVEGLALRVIEDDVPEPLRGTEIHVLDLGLLQAGASVKGEFENRLKSVIEEVKSSTRPIIMFIDEAHTLIGAGGKEGQGDAANLLKPALARGELRTIAATTWAEYKKYFERDPALTRRFQVVKVDEPDQEKAINMMRGVARVLQEHHQVRILDEAVVAAVKLSSRYIPGRQLPDKSVSLLDTACARVALSQTATPAAIEDLRRKIQQDSTNIRNLQKENAATDVHEERIALLRESQVQAEVELEQLENQWQQEIELVAVMKELRHQIESEFHRQQSGAVRQIDDEEVRDLKRQLAQLSDQLQAVQGDISLMQAAVDEQAVAEVVANWTGIPVGKMLSEEINSILNLQQRLQQRVIGQPHALQAVAKAVQTSRAGLTDPRKPVGVFLLVGTSGVGKTETALALADMLYGGDQNLTVINMSEFKEEHKVSMLLGSPPGYVGFGEGGVLTEAARRKPYSVILLDEMEKAHPGVQDIFYNLFDKGTIKDGEGRDIDFKNTIIIMTSNAGEEAIRDLYNSTDGRPDADQLLDYIRPNLLQCFKPAFLGRTTLVAYNPLLDDDLKQIAGLSMERVRQRVLGQYGAQYTFDDTVLLNIVARCQEAETGARNIENILNKTLLPELASECLQRMAHQKPINSIHVGIGDDGHFSYRID